MGVLFVKGALGRGGFHDVILPVFRANLIAWTAAKYSNDLTEYALLAALAANAAFTAADIDYSPADIDYSPADTVNAANAAVNVVYAADFATSVVHTAESATNAVADESEVWREISADITVLSRGGATADFFQQVLWNSMKSDRDWYRLLRKFFLEAENDWDVWLNWYQDRASGSETAELPRELAQELDLKIAMQPDEWWKRDPAEVNADIKTWIAEKKEQAGLVRGDNPEPDVEISQIPAAYGFRVREGKLAGYPQSGAPISADMLAEMLPELIQKAKDYQVEIEGHPNAPARLKKNASALTHTLDAWAEAPKPGVLLMRLRSLEADISAYDTDEGRAELSLDTIATMLDLKSSVADFLSLDPFIPQMEANALALQIQNSDVVKINETISTIEQIANSSDNVDQSAVEALADGKNAVENETEIIETSDNHAKVAAAIEARGKQTAYRVLSLRNFGAGLVGAVQAGAQDGVKDISSVATKVAFVALVGSVFPQYAALAAVILSLKPLAQLLKKFEKKSDDDDIDPDIDVV